ncbi:hypothetical protein lbkm_0088 [Lachnospiraceae bacterium KM106-2]|nr:hypothetical protein lbkm_0088 [Lachnospiraceae bacterium KM106-2]
MNEIFSVGDHVLHPSYGECVVRKIDKLKTGNALTDYYVLESVDAKKHKMYLPVGTHEVKLKKIEK